MSFSGFHPVSPMILAALRTSSWVFSGPSSEIGVSRTLPRIFWSLNESISGLPSWLNKTLSAVWYLMMDISCCSLGVVARSATASKASGSGWAAIITKVAIATSPAPVSLLMA